MKIVQPHKHTDLYVPGLIQMKYNSEFLDGTASIASCIFLKSPLPDWSTFMRIAVDMSVVLVPVVVAEFSMKEPKKTIATKTAIS